MCLSLFICVYAPCVCSALGSQEMALDCLELDYPASIMNPHDGSQQSTTPVSEDLILSLAFKNTRHT